MVADSKGRPLGKFQTPVQPLREDVDMIRNFLIGLQKTEDRKEADNSMSKTEKTNMVFLAGTLKFDPKFGENQAGCLIDVGQKSAVQCSIYTGGDSPKGNAELANKLKRFREGDFIKLVAMVRPYGVKRGDTWTNRLSIDITEIKTDPPRREQQKTTRQQSQDDDIPF